MTGPPLFVELCAGLASVSLRLQGGPYCRPPVSRMGNKAGYGAAILEVLGLRSGQGADSFLWCEPDDGCRALLQAYPQPGVLREAAEIIRSWADEDPRELWERLRAEGPIRSGSGGEVARWCCVTAGTTGGVAFSGGFKGLHVHRENVDGFIPRRDSIATELARWARITTSNRLINLDPETWTNTGQGGSTFGGSEFCTDPEALALGFEGVSAREVGRYALTGWWAHRRGHPESGFNHGVTEETTWTDRHGNTGTRPPSTPAKLADAIDQSSSWPPVTVCADAREIDPGKLPDGTVCYIDPPYVGTTGYGSDLDRAEVLSLARRWSDAGATVCISEAEALPALMADGWHSVEITGTRKGQKRTFSRQQREFLTLNREPAWRPAVQGRLFGAPATLPAGGSDV